MSAELDAVLYLTPSPPFSTIRDDVDRLCNLQDRYLFYLASVIFASSQIDKLLASSPVVCDRYLLTTQCYHKAAGLSRIVPVDQLDIIQPDLTVLITCAEEERRVRLVHRGMSYNDQEEQRLGVDSTMLDEYQAEELFLVDSTQLSPSEVVQKIMAELHGPNRNNRRRLRSNSALHEDSRI